MSEVKRNEEIKKEEPKPVQTPLVNPTPNTIDPLADFSEEDRKKIEAVRAFHAEQSAQSALEIYQNFGKTKSERDKIWKKWAEITKEESSAILKGIVPPVKPEVKKEPELDLTKIEDDKVRKEIVKIWFEKRTGKKFPDTKAEVLN